MKRHNFTEKEIDFILENYNEFTYKSLAELIGCSERGIQALLANAKKKKNIGCTRWRAYKAREEAIKRDKFSCVICSYNIVYEVHHIDGQKGNNDLDNLITLCPNCHAEVHLELIDLNQKPHKKSRKK